MERKDLHTHTSFSDGKHSPEEMIRAALDAGLEELGFSDHSYTSFDESYCMLREREEAYRAETAALAEKYRGRIRVRCGIEQDCYGDYAPAGFGHVVGSVHYLHVGGGEPQGEAAEFLRGEYLPVDESPAYLKAGAERFFGGDIYALIEAYYRTEADVVRRTGADIIGHFDLITKFIEREPLFEESHPRYRKAWQQAADALLAFGKPFEVNIGAILRGYRSVPYPSREIMAYLQERGGRFVFSSDCHNADDFALIGRVLRECASPADVPDWFDSRRD